MLKFIPEVKKIGENPKNFGNYQYNTIQIKRVNWVACMFLKYLNSFDNLLNVDFFSHIDCNLLFKFYKDFQ